MEHENVRGVRQIGAVLHTGRATGGVVGAPCGARKRERGAPDRRKTLYETRHWRRSWGSLWGTKAWEGCARMGAQPHADPPTGSVVGAP